MKLTFLNIGFGESVLAETDTGSILIDAGLDRGCVYDGRSHVRPADYLEQAGIRKIDVVVSTHIHSDHILGLPEVVRRFPVGELWVNALSPCKSPRFVPEDFREDDSSRISAEELRQYSLLLEICREKDIPVRELSQYEKKSAAGFSISVLSPSRQGQEKYREKLSRLQRTTDQNEFRALSAEISAESNENSAALLLDGRKSGGFRALMTADLSKEFAIPMREHPELFRAELLKAPHHGNPNCLPPGFFKTVSPDMVFLCASWDRRYGCPGLSFLKKAGEYFDAAGKKRAILCSDSLQIPPFLFSGGSRIATEVWNDSISDRLFYRLIKKRNSDE